MVHLEEDRSAEDLLGTPDGQALLEFCYARGARWDIRYLSAMWSDIPSLAVGRVEMKHVEHSYDEQVLWNKHP